MAVAAHDASGALVTMPESASVVESAPLAFATAPPPPDCRTDCVETLRFGPLEKKDTQGCTATPGKVAPTSVKITRGSCKHTNKAFKLLQGCKVAAQKRGRREGGRLQLYCSHPPTHPVCDRE